MFTASHSARSSNCNFFQGRAELHYGAQFPGEGQAMAAGCAVVELDEAPKPPAGPVPGQGFERGPLESSAAKSEGMGLTSLGDGRP